jgi:hypothetical protein
LFTLKTLLAAEEKSRTTYLLDTLLLDTLQLNDQEKQLIDYGGNIKLAIDSLHNRTGCSFELATAVVDKYNFE